MVVLKKGSAGPEVAALVADLTALGLLQAGAQSSVFNAQVSDALVAFQSHNLGPDGLPLIMDGEAGPLTLYAIDVARGRKAAHPAVTMPVPGYSARPAGASESGWNALQIARQELAAGAGEIGADNSGKDVMKYHKVTGAGAGDSWCASFVSYCFAAGNPGAMPFEPSAGAREVLARFKAKGWTYNGSLINPPLPGDIIVFWRGEATGWMGHIGLVSGTEDGLVHTIEGNRGPYPSKVSSFCYKLGQIERLLGFGRAHP